MFVCVCVCARACFSHEKEETEGEEQLTLTADGKFHRKSMYFIVKHYQCGQMCCLVLKCQYLLTRLLLHWWLDLFHCSKFKHLRFVIRSVCASSVICVSGFE